MFALIVDDSSTARLMMAYVLKDLGFEVREAPDGESALEVLRGGYRPTLMTLDWNMPGMNGGQVLKALDEGSLVRPEKVMLVTSETELAFLGRAMDQGADEYLMKPYSAAAVEEKLELLGLVPVLNVER